MNHKDMEELLSKAVNKFWRNLKYNAESLSEVIEYEDLRSEAELAVVHGMKRCRYKDPELRMPYLAKCISNALQNYTMKENYQRTNRIPEDLSDVYGETEDSEDAEDLRFLTDLSIDVNSLITDRKELEMLKLLGIQKEKKEIKRRLKITSERKYQEIKKSALTKLKECL